MKTGCGYQKSGGKVYPTLTGAAGAAPAQPRAWPTPNAVQGNNSGTIQEWGGRGNPIRESDPTLARAPLNPEWVEMLMGFPPGWTDAPLSAEEVIDRLTAGPRLPVSRLLTSHPAPDPGNPTIESD